MSGTLPPALADPIAAGVAGGWRVIDATRLERDLVLEADAVIVGTGAGGGTTAEILAEAGWRVVMLEEGPLKSSRDFRMLESDAYPQLYQESAARKTRDKAINILQGRCVGGGTTVNWTSSFRTPPATLAYWRTHFGLDGFSVDAMAPWFERMERRLSIAPWEVAPNANNAALARGAGKLGIVAPAIRRNVKGCWNLGYCGMGCPTNAKQSMLVTTIPAALDRGGSLVTGARAHRLVVAGDRITALEARAMDAAGVAPTARVITVRAKYFISAAGAIGTPALLLRSGVPDPHRLVGKRTFLHPSVVSAARMPETGRRLRRRAADDLLRSLPRHAADRWPDRLQARSAAAASAAHRDHAAGRWRRARAVDARVPPHARGDRAAARRLPRRQPRRHRAAARRRHAGARLSARPVRVGRRAPRVPVDGADPVRRRRAGSDAGARAGHGVRHARRGRSPRSRRST